MHASHLLKRVDKDSRGILSRGDPDITQYTWDHRNRLVKVEHRSSYAAAVDRVVEYACDYANRWVYRRLDDDGDGHAEQGRIFIYDGNQIVMDFWRTNSGDMQVGHLRERYIWGPAVGASVLEKMFVYTVGGRRGGERRSQRPNCCHRVFGYRPAIVRFGTASANCRSRRHHARPAFGVPVTRSSIEEHPIPSAKSGGKAPR